MKERHKPKNHAIYMAASMGIELLTEVQYWDLQKLGNFDTITSIWVKTPSDIRKLGGHFFVFVTMTLSLYITTVQNPIMQSKGSAARTGVKFFTNNSI